MRPGTLTRLLLATSLLVAALPTLSAAGAGTIAWVAREDGNGGSDVGNAVAVGPRTGDVYVVGGREGTGLTGAAVIVAYDDAGAVLWRRAYTPGPRSGASGHDVVVDPGSGTIIMLASARFDGGDERSVVVAFSPAGRLLWQSTIEPAERASVFARQLALDPTRDTVFVSSALALLGREGTQSHLVALEVGTGAVRWSGTYGASPGQVADHRPVDVAVDTGSGQVYVTGDDANATIATVAYSSAGEPLWVARSGGALGSEVNAVEADAATGNVYITGSSFTFAPAIMESLRTIAYSGTGVRLWERREPISGDDGDSDLAVDPASGSVVLASTTTAIGDRVVDLLTVAYSPSGGQLWRTVLPGTNARPGLPVFVEMDPGNGTVQVGHTYARQLHTGYALDTFDRDGVLVRQARLAPPDADGNLADLGIGPDGVYLTGTVDAGDGGTDDLDWLTIAYPPD